MTCLGFTFTTLALKKIYYYLVFVFVVAAPGTHAEIDFNGYDTIENVLNLSLFPT